MVKVKICGAQKQKPKNQGLQTQKKLKMWDAIIILFII